MVTSVVLPLALAVIMFTLGLGLKVDDFKRIFVYPRGVSIGMVNLVLISPLLAFAIAEVFNLAPLLALGLVLLGVVSGEMGKRSTTGSDKAAPASGAAQPTSKA